MSVSKYQCPTCSSASVNPRNLAVFIDGTSNKPGPKNTNVKKLYDHLSTKELPIKQHILYLDGIGTYEDDGLSLSSMGKAIYSKFQVAFAWNVEQNVQEAYRWLVLNYHHGDRIYLFGFSRGGYQVRALASMIHEVGLLREQSEERIKQAYHRYVSIHPNSPKTKETAMQFKKDFSQEGVRIHFVGVWDTVSSLGIIKKEVHITSSASVTNACHFRHALALDERRVKFMPEYFMELNAHRGDIRSPRPAIGDVKEVWFAGCHSDVGGINRPHPDGLSIPRDDEYYPIHAGNIPLLWMRLEAADEGLVFKSDEIAWGPYDVDFGREDTMKFWWRFLEILPIRHQVSFSGTGGHESRLHLFRPRSVIPAQQIHSSVLSGDAYTPRATLGDRVHIPTMPRRISDGPLWTTTGNPPDEGVTLHLLTSLFGNRRKTLESLERVLFLLDSRLDNGQAQVIPNPQLSDTFIRMQSGFDKLAFAIIFDVTSNFSSSGGLVRDARDTICTILSRHDHPDLPRALYILRFSAKHRALRQRFVAHNQVIGALMLTLEWTAKSLGENLFPLVMDILCYLIDDDDQRDRIINQLVAKPLAGETETGQTRLSLTLEVKAPSHLVASLKMITSVAQYQPGHCEGLRPGIIDLAKKKRSPVGSAAVEALVALNVQLPHSIDFSNILGYLDNTLPRLDAEIGRISLPNDADHLPFVLQVNGSERLDEKVMRKLIQTIERDVRQRTTATLTLLKLCNNLIIRDFCSQDRVLDIFIKQLEQKETSLLAAYALKTCLRLGMWTSEDVPRAAERVVVMLEKGWFDDTVGRVEGSEIFRELMVSGNLRQHAMAFNIVTTLEKKLEVGDPHETRMSLICLDILWGENPEQLAARIVNDSLALLRDKDIKVQKKGVRILSSLAQTKGGERAIKPRVNEIVRMLLPSSHGSAPSRSQLFGPTAVLYDLCKNETLREEIRGSDDFATFMILRRNSTLYPQTSSEN